MKKVFLYPLLSFLLLFVQCNPVNEDDLYYEPLVDGIYNVSVDQEQSLDFTIEPNKALNVSGQFDNGIPFTLEFESGAVQYEGAVGASVSPLTGILDMPSEFQFHFGFSFSPEGTYFTKPGKMTIELPADVDINEFKGFYFEGGVPYEGTDAEIWSVKLIPVFFESVNGKKQAVIELPHFSGFVGVSGGDFKCGNPLAADMCDDLKEILACYITGKETISSDDSKKVNKALKDWIDAGLDWLEEHPEDIDDDWELDMALREIICWKAAAQMFNSDMSPFSSQIDRVGDLFTRVLVDKLVNLNNECLSMEDMYEQAASLGVNSWYIMLLDEMRSAGLLNEDPGIDYVSYCDGIASEFYMQPFLNADLSYIRNLSGPTWFINFGPEVDPAVARSLSFTVYATNLLGEPAVMKLDEDYTITNVDANWFTLEGTTITEEVLTCEMMDGTTFPCYPTGGIRFNIVLNNSGDAITVHAGRNAW